MIPDEEKLAALRVHVPDAVGVTDGGQLGAYLPQLRIPTPSGVFTMKALLWPHAHSGYTTRLFLERQVPTSKATNWTSHVVGGQPWQVVSWNHVPDEGPWIAILRDHLKVFQ